MSMTPVLSKRNVLDLAQRPMTLALATTLISVAYGVALAYSVSGLWLVAVPIAAAIAFAALFKPELAAIALIGITWGYLSEAANRSYGIPSLTKPLAGLLALTLIVRRFTGRRTGFVSDTTTWWMLAYLIVIGVGLWYARSPARVLQLLNDFAKDLVLYLVLINLITSKKNLERCIWLLLAVGALLGTLTMYQEITHNYRSDFGGLVRTEVAQIADGIANRPRAGGSTGEPLAFGQQLLTLVPIGLWAIIYGRSLFARCFAAYATVACLAGIGLSFSRSSYVALAVTLALFALHIRLNPRYILPIVALVGVLLWIAPPEFSARFQTLQNLLPSGDTVNIEDQGFNSEASYRMRSIQLGIAFDMFIDHPILGVGAWNFTELYDEYVNERGVAIATSFGPPHNYYLEIAAEHGLIGLSVILGILVLAFSRLRLAQRLFALSGDYRLSRLAVALQIGLVGYLISAAFLHGLYSRFLWLQVSLAVAFALIATKEQTKNKTKEQGNKGTREQRKP
ncbi:MAG TPA: O-antigen ligase family protein [Herpetosiphonaceae bacterium]